MVGGWLLTALAASAITLLQGLLVQYQWLARRRRFFTLCRERCAWASCCCTAAWSPVCGRGLAGGVQANISRLWSYAALFTYGAVLISVGLGAPWLWLVWPLLIGRGVAMMVSAYG